MIHVLVTVFEFTDGGMGGTEVARGTEAEMQELREGIPAVSYSGDRPVKSSGLIVVTAEDWAAATQPPANGGPS